MPVRLFIYLIYLFFLKKPYCFVCACAYASVRVCGFYFFYFGVGIVRGSRRLRVKPV